MTRRAFDITFATIALIAALPLTAICAVAIKLDSHGPWLFRQRRVGLRGKEFTLLKLRTMTHRPHRLCISEGCGDARVTRTGRWIRRLRFDELPQLINVLRGDMSIVGPRPEVPRYVNLYTPRQRAVLDVRPGITDPASIAFRDEERRLDGVTDKERYYIDHILPAKVEMQIDYMSNRTLLSDLRVIAATAAAMTTDLLRRIKTTVYEK